MFGKQTKINKLPNMHKIHLNIQTITFFDFLSLK